MLLADKSSHLNSDEHKNKTEQQLVSCEDCGKNVSDKTRHFRSETHFWKSQQRNSSQDNTQSGTASLPSHTASLASHIECVELIVNEKYRSNFK